MHIYDYIVIGSGLTGMTIASKISQETKNILLLESENHIGGANRPASLQSEVIENGLRFYPNTDLSSQALFQLENFLDVKLVAATKENHPETYDASGFKSFVGFGDKSPEFYHQLAYFLNSSEIQLTQPLHQIINLISARFQGETSTRSYVTKFNFTDGKLTHVTVNGTKHYYANNFIFTGNVRDLNLLMPDDFMSARAKAKLKKDTAWMGLCLDLFHEVPVGTPVVEKDNLFILNGTTDDDIGPCVGRFNPALTPQKQISQWISFVDVDTAEETENIAEVLKKMKRQIKRAFPDMAEHIKGERLFMSSPLSCGDIKLNANGTLHKVDNLWIASPQVSAYPNLLGSLLQSQLTLAALGFGTAPAIQQSALSPDEITAEAEL
jgi:hypothetical protein